jgi:hypothetical protein
MKQGNESAQQVPQLMGLDEKAKSFDQLRANVTVSPRIRASVRVFPDQASNTTTQTASNGRSVAVTRHATFRKPLQPTAHSISRLPATLSLLTTPATFVRP